MSDFEVKGADQFLQLSKALKRAGHTQLRRDLNAAMRKAAKPLVQDARAAFLADLPHGGGLNKFMAHRRITPVTATGRDPGVKIKVAKQDKRIDTEGRIAHQVFGRNPRVVQQVKPHIFSDAMLRGAPKVRRGLEQALDDMGDRIVREVGRG